MNTKTADSRLRQNSRCWLRSSWRKSLTCSRRRRRSGRGRRPRATGARPRATRARGPRRRAVPGQLREHAGSARRSRSRRRGRPRGSGSRPCGAAPISSAGEPCFTIRPSRITATRSASCCASSR